MSATPRPTEEWGAGDGSGSVDVAATTDPGSVPNVDLVVMFVKRTATATAVDDAAETGLLGGGRTHAPERPRQPGGDRGVRPRRSE